MTGTKCLRGAGALAAVVVACGCAFARAAGTDDAAVDAASGATPAADGDARLLVVAPHLLAEAMEPLIVHKRRTGMPARLVVIESLERSSGRDDAERVKRAIVAAHEQHGTRYVLLVGDASRCPVRFRKVAQVPAEADADCTYNPTDLYYANLYKDHVPGGDAADPTAIVHSGKADDWDANGDGVFDEQHWAQDAVSFNPDRVDGCPDVAVGRLPAHTPEEAATYVAKVISYESTPSRFKNCARFSFVADANYGGSTALCEAILRDGVGAGFPSATSQRLLANVPADGPAAAPWKSATFAAIAFAVRCTGWVVYVGHADARCWAVREAGQVYDSARVAAIGGCEKPAVVLAVGCETGRFACWAPSERYVDEDGRAHEFVRVGAARPGSPRYDPFASDYDQAEEEAYAAAHPGYAERFNRSAARGAWRDTVDGETIRVRLTVPRPCDYDLPENHDRTFACAWLFARTGAIVYAGECLVCENDKGAELVRDVLARGAKGGTVVGDMWLEGQRRYWLDNRASEGVFRNPRIYLGIMTLFGDPSLRLQAAAGE